MASAQEVVARQGDELNAGQSAQSTREDAPLA